MNRPVLKRRRFVPASQHRKDFLSTLRLAAAILCRAVRLAARGGSGDDKLAREVNESADNRAHQLEQRAEDLQDQVGQVRKIGEKRGDAIEAADPNTQAMSAEHEATIVGNQTPAVR